MIDKMRQLLQKYMFKIKAYQPRSVAAEVPKVIPVELFFSYAPP
jgi:hypothetical protein